MSPDFSPHFCWRKCADKFSRKIPCKILQNSHANKDQIGTSPPPPPKRAILWAYGVFQQKEPKHARRPLNWGSHFRPQNCGRKSYGHQAFSESGKMKVSTPTVPALFSKMALTGQRTALVDMVLLAFPAFPSLPWWLVGQKIFFALWVVVVESR